MNMGNYAHGNQPVQHMIYLYDYAGQPWKAQYWLREVMNRLYNSRAETRITGKLRLGMSFPPSVFIRSVRVPTSM